MPWKHILGTVYTVSEDWQEASSWNFYLKLKGDQRLVMRSRREMAIVKKSQGWGDFMRRGLGVQANTEMKRNAISSGSLAHKTVLEWGTKEARRFGREVEAS